MNNRTMVILVAVIAVLVVVIGIVMTQGTPSATAPVMPGTPTPTTPAATPPAASGPPTKLPAGATPLKWVQDYYQAVVAGNFAKAYKMLPAASRAMYDEAGFASQQKSYGMKSFSIAGTTTQGKQLLVDARQDLGTNGKWQSVWTFEKQGTAWVALHRSVSMAK